MANMAIINTNLLFIIYITLFSYSFNNIVSYGPPSPPDNDAALRERSKGISGKRKNTIFDNIVPDILASRPNIKPAGVMNLFQQFAPISIKIPGTVYVMMLIAHGFHRPCDYYQ